MKAETVSIRKKFGANVAAERARRRWSQEELADKAGISRNYLGRVERGESSPSIVSAQNLADALDVDVGTLLDGEP